MWTQFWDMHSGGSQKLDWPQIYIEAPEEEAKVIFYNVFGRSPERVTCTCCGPDYSVSEYETLEEASAFHRGLRTAIKNGQKRYSNHTKYLEPGEPLPEGYYLDQDGFDRFEGYPDGVTVEQFITLGRAHAIRADDIKPLDRLGELPEEGYVWMD